MLARSRLHRGFTLIEVMTAVVIVIILASLAVTVHGLRAGQGPDEQRRVRRGRLAQQRPAARPQPRLAPLHLHPPGPWRPRAHRCAGAPGRAPAPSTGTPGSRPRARGRPRVSRRHRRRRDAASRQLGGGQPGRDVGRHRLPGPRLPPHPQAAAGALQRHLRSPRLGNPSDSEQAHAGPAGRLQLLHRPLGPALRRAALQRRRHRAR